MQRRRWWVLVPALAVAGLITWLVCRDVPESPSAVLTAPDASVAADAGYAAIAPLEPLPNTGVVSKPPSGRGLIGYGRAYRSFVTGAANAAGRVEHVIAIRDLGPDLTAQLDVLSTTGVARPAPLTTGATAQVRSLRVSSRTPEGVAWVDSVDKAGLGTIMYADMDRKASAAVPVPNGDHAPEDAIQFGANGHQLLIHSETADGTSKLYWWNGSGQPKLIGEKAPTFAARLSADGSVAVVGVGLDRSSGLGDLLLVEMATGKVTPVAEHVALVAAAYESEDQLLALAREPAFGLSRNGQHVACASAAGAVTLWTRGKGTTDVGDGGRFPSPSEDGTSVAYYAGKRLVVWTSGTSTTFPASGAFTPVWSPDSLFVAFLTKYTMKGSHVMLGDVKGDVSVLQLGDSLPTRWAKDAAWQSVRFEPSAGETRTLAVFGRLPERGDGQPHDEALEDVVVGDPADEPDTAVEGIRADAYRILPRSRGVAFTEATRVRTSYSAGVWTPAAGGRADVVTGALDSTLQVADFSTPGRLAQAFADDCLVLSDPNGTSFGGSYVVANLMGFTPGGDPFRIKSDVLAATFTRDGRVLALTQEPGSDSNADIWILPFAPFGDGRGAK